jgi:PAS domain S-box-containing protein
MSRLQEKTFGISITLVIAAIITIAVFSYRQTRKVNFVTSRIEYTRAVLLQVSDLYTTVIEHAGSARNYSLNGKEEEVSRMQSTSSTLLSKLDALKTLVKNNPAQRMRTDSMSEYIMKRIEFSNQLITTGKDKGIAAVAQLYQTGTGRDYNNIVLSFIQKIQAAELNTLQQDEQKNAGGIKQLANYLLGLFVFILALILIIVQKSRLDIAERKRTELYLKSFNQRLQEEVNEKTRDLTGVFERISDAFIALDKNFRYTYINKKAGEVINLDPASLVGKIIWEEFPEDIRQRVYDAVHHTMATQQYLYLEEYYPAFDLWFEFHLYPSPEGLSIFFRNISKRKKAEDEIRKSEERYKALIEQASDAIMITDSRGNFIDVNTSFCNQFGYTKGELMGLNISKVIDAEQLKTDPVRFDLLLAGQTISRERKMVHKNSTIIEVEANVKLLPDGRLLAIARNITERKKNTEEKERVRYLLNERVKELTTLYQAGQILQSEYKSPGSALKEIVAILPAGWQYPAIAAARISLGDSVFATPNFADSSYRQNARFKTPDGKTGIVEVVYLEEKPVENEGPFLAEERNLINMISEMLRVFFSRRDASDIILKEKNLSDSVINSMPGIFYFYDHSGRFIRWNKRFELVSGYSGEEISKMHPLDFFEGDDKEHIKNRIGEVFEKGVSDAEALFLTKDKRKVSYYFTGASVEIDGVPYLLGTGIDITERKKAEQELRISRENLERSYEEIRLLASNIERIREEEKIKIAREIHDELGQQLTGLKMDVSWLNKKLAPGETVLRDKVKEILALLDDTVKSVRRIASELRPGLLDDLGLVAAIEWHSQEFQKRSGIKTKFILPKKEIVTPPNVSTGLFRIFQESLTNVARHAAASEIVASLDQVKNDIILKITDNGKGFDTNGTGNKKTLGLLGMKERVMMMDGQFEITSKPGNGTTVIVSVTLPPGYAPKPKSFKASL